VLHHPDVPVPVPAPAYVRRKAGARTVVQVDEGWLPTRSLFGEESVDAGGTRGEYLEWVRSSAFQLCRLRLRFLALDRWSLAIYSCTQERYEASVFADGGSVGRPRDGFDLAANLYLA